MCETGLRLGMTRISRQSDIEKEQAGQEWSKGKGKMVRGVRGGVPKVNLAHTHGILNHGLVLYLLPESQRNAAVSEPVSCRTSH